MKEFINKHRLVLGILGILVWGIGFLFLMADIKTWWSAPLVVSCIVMSFCGWVILVEAFIRRS